MDGTGRCRIEFGLAAGESARSIAKALGVSLSTVTREIGKHAYESFKGCYGRANQCVHRQGCKLTGVCGDCPAKGAPCVRGAQGDKTPYDVFEFLYGDGTAAKLHIAKIDPKEVVLKPRLVGIEMK